MILVHSILRKELSSLSHLFNIPLLIYQLQLHLEYWFSHLNGYTIYNKGCSYLLQRVQPYITKGVALTKKDYFQIEKRKKASSESNLSCYFQSVPLYFYTNILLYFSLKQETFSRLNDRFSTRIYKYVFFHSICNFKIKNPCILFSHRPGTLRFFDSEHSTYSFLQNRKRQ